MVEGADVLLEPAAQEPPDQGHERLKAPEPGPRDQGVPELYSAQGQALAYGYGEGVHGKAHRQDEQLRKTHALQSPFRRRVSHTPVYTMFFRMAASCTRGSRSSAKAQEDIWFTRISSISSREAPSSRIPARGL